MTKLAQRYARATQSNNLRSDELHYDVDSLAAVALSSEFGGMLFRVKYANDSSSYVRLAEVWEWEVKKRAALQRWPTRINDAKVAKASLKYWLNDICPACQGHGVTKKPFEEALSDEPCDVCEGSGKRPIECHPELLQYVQRMVCALDEVAATAGQAAMAKLASEMDFL